MTYDAPNGGPERNLGQKDVNSTGSWIAGLVFVGLVAFGGWYFYSHSDKSADLNRTAAGESTAAKTPSSGPGVKGAEGGTNGPAAGSSSSSTGASSGTSGSNASGDDPGTQPSQDASGVSGAPGSTNGPASGSNSNGSPTDPKR